MVASSGKEHLGSSAKFHLLESIDCKGSGDQPSARPVTHFYEDEAFRSSALYRLKGPRDERGPSHDGSDR